MPTGREVADRAKAYAEKGAAFGVGYCLRFTRICAGAPAGTPSAITAWRNAKYRHGAGTPPRGSFVFWEGGKAGHGHVAISDGAGYVWSTDIKRPAKVDRVSIAYLGARWPNQKYLGWSEDVNGVRVTLPLAAPVAIVQLSALRPGRSGLPVQRLQQALRQHGFGRLNPSGVTGYFGKETLAMVRAFQQSHPALRDDADGVPGPKTAALLGLHVI